MNERPTGPIKKRSIFDRIKSGFKRARDAFAPMFKEQGDETPTQNEMRLDSNEWMVKRKLGRSFFTKRLNHNTRVARVASLNHQEWLLARARGWV